MAISVVVEKCAPSPPTRRTLFPETGLFRNVSKCAIAIVAIQTILPEAGAEDVVEAVIVIVGDANAVRPTRHPQARFICDIGESAVAVVLVEAIRRLRRCSFQACAGE